jgi:iron complex transport system substrate-binding protein
MRRGLVVCVALLGGGCPGAPEPGAPRPAASPPAPRATVPTTTTATAARRLEPPSVAVQWLSEARPSGPPRRVASLAPSLTELLFALEAGDRVVGVSSFCDHPPEVARLPRLGGFIDPNAEAILAVRPDLVVAVPSPANRPALERVAALGRPVLVVPGNGYDDTFHALDALGLALGGDGPARAAALASRIELEVAAAVARHPGARGVRAAMIFGHRPLVVAGPGSFADRVLSRLGAVNVVTEGGAYPTWSLERLVIDAPEVLLDAAMVPGLDDGWDWSRFPRLPAVREGRVVALDDPALLRAGPRLARAVDRLGAALAR